jgi:hypothetical protein
MGHSPSLSDGHSLAEFMLKIAVDFGNLVLPNEINPLRGLPFFILVDPLYPEGIGVNET